MREFSVLGCGLYTPQIHSVEQWRDLAAIDHAAFDSAAVDSAAVDNTQPPKGAALDRRSRRLSSELMRALSDVAYDAMTHANVDAATIASVYGSALGEVQTMLKLLSQISIEKTAPSPMAFAASVHNAASGVNSISFKNQSFTTSVAANHDTPAMSLIEAAALLATGTPEVLIACGDEHSPDLLMGAHPTWRTVSAAVVLSAVQDHPQRIATIRMPTLACTEDPREYVAPPALGDALRHNPSVGMLYLVTAILEQRTGLVRLDAGEGSGWSTHVQSV